MSITRPIMRPITSPITRAVTAAGVGGGFAPSSIPSLSMWLDASQLEGADGATVSTWTDRSGSGNNATAAGTPTNAVTVGLNGRRAVRLNGTNAKFTTPAFLTSGYGNAFTIFMAMQSEAGHTDNRVPFSVVGMNCRMELNGGTLQGALNIDGLAGEGVVANLGKNGVMGLTVGSGFLSFGLDRFWHQNTTSARAGSASVSRRTNGVSGAITFTGNALTIGALGTGFYYPGLLGEVLVYNRDLSTAECQQVASYLATKWGFCAKPLIVLGGNSLTSGTSSTGGPNQDVSAAGTNYPSRVLNALAATHDVRTDAYPGRNFDQLISESPAFADVMVTRNGQRQIYVMWEITNQLMSGTTKENVLAKLQTACLARRAAGFSVLVGTCLNRGDGGVNFNADRQWINTQILSGFSAYADGVVDFAAQAELSNPANATYFAADTIHLTDAGYQIVANTLVAKLSALAVPSP